MSYPQDLEEYSDEALEKELKRRNELRGRGLCSYCEKPLDNKNYQSDKPCRFHETWIGEQSGKVWGRTVLVKRKI